MEKLKFAVLGCGFWSKFQMGAWTEVEGAELVAVYNRTRSKADKIAGDFMSPGSMTILRSCSKTRSLISLILSLMLTHIQNLLDWLHNKEASSVRSQWPPISKRKKNGTMFPKPAPGFYIHENYRWQAPVRRLKQIVNSGVIGKPFRCQFILEHGFPAI